MNDLLERLEAMGRTGGVIAVGIAGVLLGGALVLIVLSLGDEASEQARWTSGGVRFTAFLLFALALPTAFVGARLLTQNQYPAASEVFPPMTVVELKRALAEREGDICVCSRCKVIVPAEFSTGSCPVCASSVEYHEVRSDEDADMVIASVS